MNLVNSVYAGAGIVLGMVLGFIVGGLSARRVIGAIRTALLNVNTIPGSEFVCVPRDYFNSVFGAHSNAAQKKAARG